jgi:hypothetical protein
MAPVSAYRTLRPSRRSGAGAETVAQPKPHGPPQAGLLKKCASRHPGSSTAQVPVEQAADMRHGKKKKEFEQVNERRTSDYFLPIREDGFP